MNIRNIFLSALAVVALASCQMIDGADHDLSEYGTLSLSVDAQAPKATRAGVDVSNFPVNITDGKDLNYDYTASALPSSITLPVGQYTVSAHTPGDMEKKMTAPYYAGEKVMEIQKDITTETEVECKMQNSRIQVNCGEVFLQTYSEWTVTVDDGSSSVLVFSSDSNEPVYWAFPKNVATLTVNVIAKTVADGREVKGRLSLTKADAAERYDDDSEYFCGGDAIVLHLAQGMDDKTSTQPAKFTVTASITFSESETSVDIPVNWETDEGDDDNDGDKGEGAPSIAFSQAEVTYSMSNPATRPNPLNAVIKTPMGLKSLKVKIETDNAGFATALADMIESGLDLQNGQELVGDEILPVVFSGLGIELSMPAAGCTEYVFPISAFYPFLEIYEAGSNTFYITLEDNAGNKLEDKLVLNITE